MNGDVFNKDFYDKMMETHNDVKYIKNAVPLIEKRVDTLEKDKIKVVTAGGVLGALVAFCVKLWPK